MIFATFKRFLFCTGRASHGVHVAQNVKFLVKLFKSLYLLNSWMDLVNTLPDV